MPEDSEFRRRARAEGKFRRMLSGRLVPSQLRRADALETINLKACFETRGTDLHRETAKEMFSQMMQHLYGREAVIRASQRENVNVTRYIFWQNHWKLFPVPPPANRDRKGQ